MIKKFTKAIRIVSIPPIVATVTILILYFTNYIDLLNSILLIIFLSIIQLLAYPLSYLVPKYKEQGREGQRTLAFYIGIIGYSLGLGYAIFSNIPEKLKVLYLTYFVSIIVLTFINKVLKVRASGHITSITGPLIALSYFMGPLIILPTLIFYVLVFFSSLYLKRHTIKEMIYGTLVVLGSFSFSLLIMLI